MGCLAMLIYLGCYTDSANLNGLKALRLDESTGRMEVVAEYAVSNAIYQALSSDGRILYSVVSRGVASFSVAPDGALAKIGQVDVGSTPCHISILPGEDRVAWAAYSAGLAGSVKVSGGRFGEVVVHRHSGSGPNLPRQNAAHCHQALPAPGGGYCVVDLGLDQVITYPEGRVFTTSPTGAGPRHMVFHPNAKMAFLVYELGNFVSSLRVEKGGDFTMLDIQYTLPPKGTGRGPNGDLAAAIRLTPDMKRVVVSNRGEESLVAYDFDISTGKLSLAARSQLPGSWPRDFAFVTDSLALVAMERSGDVHALRYDAATGRFDVIATISGFFRPVAITAVP